MAETKFPIHSRSHYYGGDLTVIVPDPQDYTYESVRLEWNAYFGGSSALDLSWEEVKELSQALNSVWQLRPEWVTS